MSRALLGGLVLIGGLGLGACGGTPTQSAEISPLILVPGLGMSALQVEVERPGAQGVEFDFLVPAMNPVEILPNSATSALAYSIDSGLAPADVDSVQRWLSLDIAADGTVRNQEGVSVQPVSIGTDFAAECPRYLPMIDELLDTGWVADANVYCAPFDYRFPPGANTFAGDIEALIDSAVAKAGGSKVVLACHSQGCLMAYHALRTLDADWVRTHVETLFGFAGQFSGCSDCLRWAFQPGWSWDPDDESASPVDPTWAGEMALGLQESVYGSDVLYRNGDIEYRAADSARLLNDAGALAMQSAQDRYSLDSQTWFQQGDELRMPLNVPSRFVFGIGTETTVGYRFASVPTRAADCVEPECAGFYSQSDPLPIQADGDGGDSTRMNAAPARWTQDAACDVQRIPGAGHMDILTNSVALAALTLVAQSTSDGAVPCLNSPR